VADQPDRDPSFETLLDEIKESRGFDFTGTSARA